MKKSALKMAMFSILFFGGYEAAHCVEVEDLLLAEQNDVTNADPYEADLLKYAPRVNKEIDYYKEKVKRRIKALRHAYGNTSKKKGYNIKELNRVIEALPAAEKALKTLESRLGKENSYLELYKNLMDVISLNNSSVDWMRETKLFDNIILKPDDKDEHKRPDKMMQHLMEEGLAGKKVRPHHFSKEEKIAAEKLEEQPISLDDPQEQMEEKDQEDDIRIETQDLNMQELFAPEQKELKRVEEKRAPLQYATIGKTNKKKQEQAIEELFAPEQKELKRVEAKKIPLQYASIGKINKKKPAEVKAEENNSELNLEEHEDVAIENIDDELSLIPGVKKTESIIKETPSYPSLKPKKQTAEIGTQYDINDLLESKSPVSAQEIEPGKQDDFSEIDINDMLESTPPQKNSGVKPEVKPYPFLEDNRIAIDKIGTPELDINDMLESTPPQKNSGVKPEVKPYPSLEDNRIAVDKIGTPELAPQTPTGQDVVKKSAEELVGKKKGKRHYPGKYLLKDILIPGFIPFEGFDVEKFDDALIQRRINKYEQIVKHAEDKIKKDPHINSTGRWEISKLLNSLDFDAARLRRESANISKIVNDAAQAEQDKKGFFKRGWGKVFGASTPESMKSAQRAADLFKKIEVKIYSLTARILNLLSVHAPEYFFEIAGIPDGRVMQLINKIPDESIRKDAIDIWENIARSFFKVAQVNVEKIQKQKSDKEKDVAFEKLERKIQELKGLRESNIIDTYGTINPTKSEIALDLSKGKGSDTFKVSYALSKK